MLENGAELQISLEHIAAHYSLANPDPFFVQIGVYDGASNDPLCDVILKHGWRGVLVEPQRKAFERLQERHGKHPQLVLKNAAISGEDGKRTLFSISEQPGLPDWAYQVASFDRSHVEKQHPHLRAFNVGASIVAEEVDCITFNTLFRELGISQVDVLQVDTEGFDYEVIKLFDVQRRLPAIVNFEHVHLSRRDWEAAVRLLVCCGYKVAKSGWGDTLAYRR